MLACIVAVLVLSLGKTTSDYEGHNSFLKTVNAIASAPIDAYSLVLSFVQTGTPTIEFTEFQIPVAPENIQNTEYDLSLGKVVFDRRQNFSDRDWGYVLLSLYDTSVLQSKVLLVDIKTGEIKHTWSIQELNEVWATVDPVIEANGTLKHALEVDRNDRRYLHFHPYVTESGTLISQHNSPLLAIDACNQLAFKVDGNFHHSIEPDNDPQFVWVPDTRVPGEHGFLYKNYRDFLVSKVDLEAKQVAFSKSVTTMLMEAGIFEKVTGGVMNGSGNALHLNDIEVARSDTEFWQKGDLFISLNEISTIIQYRPSTDQIVWHKTGPWRRQHDVDLISDTELAVFDNRISIYNWGIIKALDSLKYVDDETAAETNSVVIHDMSTGEDTRPFKNLFENLDRINTVTGGLQHFVDRETVIAEATDNGRIVAGTNDEVFWTFQWNSQIRWFRYLDRTEGDALVNQLGELDCK